MSCLYWLTVCEIGEIKSSKKADPDAQKQLKRSLLFNKWLYKIICAQPYKYELGGDIFFFDKKGNNYIRVPIPQKNL